MRTFLVRGVFLCCASMSIAACSTYMSSVPISDDDGAFEESVQSYSLPKGMIKVEVTKEPVTLKPIASATAEIIGDSRYRFRVKYRSNWLSSDAITLKTDDSGLLKTIWSKVQDRTYQVAVNLARSIGAFQGFTVPAGGLRAASETCDAETIPDDLEKMYLDPYAADNPKWISIEDPGAGRQTKPPVLESKQLEACNRGVCTRPLRPWLVKINIACRKVGGKDNLKQRHEIIYLPDERDLLVIDLDRAFMVEKRFYAIFNKGMLSEVRLSRGSSAEELAKLPEAILKALVSVPKELVELRYNYSVQRKDLSGAELERLKQQDALLEYWRSREKKPDAAPAPPAPSQPAAPTEKKPEPPAPEPTPPATDIEEPPAPEEPPATPSEPPPPELFDDVTPTP